MQSQVGREMSLAEYVGVLPPEHRARKELALMFRTIRNARKVLDELETRFFPCVEPRIECDVVLQYQQLPEPPLPAEAVAAIATAGEIPMSQQEIADAVGAATNRKLTPMDQMHERLEDCRRERDQFAARIDDYDGQVSVLAAMILSLGLRGTENDGACVIAAKRLMHYKETERLIQAILDSVYNRSAFVKNVFESDREAQSALDAIELAIKREPTPC